MKEGRGENLQILCSRKLNPKPIYTTGQVLHEGGTVPLAVCAGWCGSVLSQLDLNGIFSLTASGGKRSYIDSLSFISSPISAAVCELSETYFKERYGSGGFRKRKHDNFPHGQRREEKENVNPPSALMTSFKSFQLELDTRHDKYERLVKLSRDITIESKRTIFLLHRFISAPNGEEILNESEVKLDAVRRKIKQVAQELIGEDMYQFHRAVSPGLQEYVEAVSFQYFIKTRSLISVEEINKQLIFTAEDREETTNMTSNSHDKQPHTWSLRVTPVDYLLGVADLTGELMRLCISSVGNGDIDTPFELSQFLRQIYDGFTFIGNTGPYEVSKKLYTLKQSLAKVENACYTLKVRGSEIPKHMLADVFSTKTELIDQEEGLP
ncbi:PREDICTED: translin-associated protein X [Ficedula albicollis]|uniref:translin-associated protein X n=1 Tax=Ficedula albicollis TaxID=59894 RepID=UPI0007AD8CC9|nr:PREDICTED: translin-associated protein X [Ficedula albicollis]